MKYIYGMQDTSVDCDHEVVMETSVTDTSAAEDVVTDNIADSTPDVTDADLPATENSVVAEVNGDAAVENASDGTTNVRELRVCCN